MLVIGPNRPFNPAEETQEDYELNALFPIGIFSEKNGLVLLKEEKQPLRSYPGDRGDEAIVGDLYRTENQKLPTDKKEFDFFYPNLPMSRS